jgi:hypothetical protein
MCAIHENALMRSAIDHDIGPIFPMFEMASGPAENGVALAGVAGSSLDGSCRSRGKNDVQPSLPHHHPSSLRLTSKSLITISHPRVSTVVKTASLMRYNLSWHRTVERSGDLDPTSVQN